MALTPSQTRHLRGLAHALKPVILVGGKGITPALVAELGTALDHHELVKVKLAGEDRQVRQEQILTLAAETGAEVVQRIGHVASYYRRHPDAPKIALPR